MHGHLGLGDNNGIALIMFLVTFGRRLNDIARRRRLLARRFSAVPLEPLLVAANSLLEPLASTIGALIGIGRGAMRFQTHALPQMDGAVGSKLAALLLDAHMPRRFAPDELRDGMGDALLDVTAQRLTDVEILPSYLDLYRHCRRKTVLSPFRAATP